MQQVHSSLIPDFYPHSIGSPVFSTWFPVMSDKSRQKQLLVQGAIQLDLEPTAEQISSLLGLIDLLARWNRAFNLTAVRDPLRMVSHHLLDSLALAPYLRGDDVLDVGTGAGFPGLPLAIVQPQRRFVLLDSNGKKVRFVRQAVMELGLQNVEAVQSRIESYRSGEKFATILARAFAPLPDIVRLVSPLLQPQGVLLAAKSRRAGEEMRGVEDSGGDFIQHRLRVPFLDAERSLVEFRLNSSD
jgi:16S rRNA (guanine527-N7)-methyltransferase